MAGIFDRYLFRETALTWVAVAAVLVLVVVVNRFAVYLGEAANGQIPAAATFALLGLSVLGLLEIILPVALFLAVVVTLGRFYRDQEMVAAFACGMTPRRLYRPFAVLGVLAAVLLAVLALWASPWAHATSHRMMVHARSTAQVSVMEAGRFKPLSGDRGVFYVGGIDRTNGELRSVFSEMDTSGGSPMFIVSTGGRMLSTLSGERYLELGPGHRYEAGRTRLDWTVTRFAGARVLVRPPGRQPAGAADYDRMPTSELIRLSEPGARAALEWRLVQPLTVLLLILIGVPLAHMRPRQGRYARLVPAILVYLIYFNLLSVARAWVGHGEIASLPGIWWVPGFAFVFGVWLVWQRFGRRRVRRIQSVRHAG